MSADQPLKNAKHEKVLQAYIADQQRIGFKAYLVCLSSIFRRRGENRLLAAVEKC
jgi:hypothetical protein